jgi:hypothetical protein
MSADDRWSPLPSLSGMIGVLKSPSLSPTLITYISPRSAAFGGIRDLKADSIAFQLHRPLHWT